VEYALDFGCGRSKLLAKILHQKGIRTDAYDPIYYPDALKDDKKYDLIVSTEVFEHLHKPAEVFASLVSRLNPGGYLAIQTAFYPDDMPSFKHWYYHKDPTHIVFFCPKTFVQLCKKNNCFYIADNGKNMIIMRKNPKTQ
jgi:trans-aconitate methyltransferase